MSTPYTTAQADELRAKDTEFVMRPWTHPAGEPVIVAHAKGCVVTDVHGKEYLDFTAGYFVNNAGHCHPRIVEAATQQLTKVLQVSGKHGSVPAILLAERLIKLAPKSVRKAFFSTGGSEANEFAIKMARQSTGKPDIAYLENGYHGLTIGALEVTHSEPYRKTAGRPLGDSNYALPNAYCYRCKYGSEAQCLTGCLDELEAKLTARAGTTAALIAEPIQAVGGIAPSKQWWERVDQIRRKLGILLILDEVQTGLGRTGTMFAVDHYGLQPDIITGGKGLSGGVGSLAVTMASDAVVKGFFGGTTPTSGGNAVSAAAGLALIDAIVDEGMIENAAAMGRYFTDAAWGLEDPWIGDVRFTGLLGGIELVADRGTKEPLGKKQISAIKDQLHAEGMLITVTGMLGNVLRLQPPLCITAAQLDQFIAVLAKTLQTVRATV